MRQKSSVQDGGPVRPRQKCRHDVGEQHHSQPLEDAGDETVRSPDQQAGDQQGKEGCPVIGRNSGYHVHRIGHAAQIRADVEHVRDNQQQAGRPQYPPRILQSDRAPEPASRHHSEPRTHQLHRRHQRERNQGSPQEGISENRARYRVGRDSRRVVVRRARNQPRPEVGEEPRHHSKLFRPIRGVGALHTSEARHDCPPHHILRPTNPMLATRPGARAEGE